MIPVESVESFFGPEPEEAIFILEAAENGAVGEAVLYLEMPEIIGLCICLAKAGKYQQG
jgi:hypothetical protein